MKSLDWLHNVHLHEVLSHIYLLWANFTSRCHVLQAISASVYVSQITSFFTSHCISSLTFFDDTCTTRRGWGCTPDKLKPQGPSPDQIFISFGGGGVLQTNIPEILEWGHSRNFWTKNSGSLACCIADSLLHTMCVETIIAYQEREDSCTILMCDED